MIYKYEVTLEVEVESPFGEEDAQTIIYDFLAPGPMDADLLTIIKMKYKLKS